MQDIQMRKLNESDLQLLKSINERIFNVKYEYSFYKTVLSSENTSTFLICESFNIIGSVSFTLEELSVYVNTFGIIPEFRNQGKGTKYWKIIEKHLRDELRCRNITLHTHTSNLIARDFYISNGFNIAEICPDYYEDIHPASAYFMSKHI